MPKPSCSPRRPVTAPEPYGICTAKHTAQGTRRSNILEHHERRARSHTVNPHTRGGHFTQYGRNAAMDTRAARADYEGWGVTDRPMQSFTRGNPPPLLTERGLRVERDQSLSASMKAIHPKGDHLMQSCMGPKLKDRKLLMGGRNSFHHGHESAVDQRNLNTWSTYPYLTRLENTNSSGQQFKRTMPMEDPGDGSAYTHQQKQILTSASRVGSFWYDAQKQDGLHGCRKPMDSVWFGSLRRADSGGHLLGNLRARGTDGLDRPELFQGTPVYSNTMCYGR